LISKNEPPVGLQIREIRTSQGLSIRALAAKCGMSANAISLIERGLNSPTVSSLHRLSTALNVPITDFFSEDINQTAVLVKRDQGVRYRNGEVELESLGIGLPNQQLEPFRLTIEPQSGTLGDPISHPGQEFVFCLKGEIEYFVDDEPFILKAGDSLLLEATHPHGWRNSTEFPAKVLMIFQAAQDHYLARQSHLAT
jgi:transcriptional regulator with XRE-family HTH domain